MKENLQTPLKTIEDIHISEGTFRSKSKPEEEYSRRSNLSVSTVIREFPSKIIAPLAALPLAKAMAESINVEEIFPFYL